MTRITRREFVLGSAAASVAMATKTFAQPRQRGGTLRMVPLADLKILDPVWTTSYVTRDHGYMIYDTLFAADANRRIQPQMVEKYSVSKDGMRYSFSLRDGLRFHGGQPVTAEDCVVSLQRWGKKDTLGKPLLAATEKLRAVDKKTFVLELREPFGPVLDALAKDSGNVAFIMPARLAATSENEQIKEAVGSGPYKFVKEEWQPGHQVVYVRNPDYVPRNEPPSGAAGGKRVYLDRVIWRYIADPATASAALVAGEIDYWHLPQIDFVPPIEKNPNLTVFVRNPRGTQGVLRPNHLHPPFNNKKARQALLWMADQEMYLQAAIGQAKYYRTCRALFTCGGAPYESLVGAPPRHDLERARQLLKEAGYDGRPVVLLDPADYPLVHGATLVTRELLMKIGVNVDMQTTDWGTVVSRRAKKDAPKDGGWNIFNTTFVSSDLETPAINTPIAGTCEKGFFGWYCSEQMEKLRGEWLRTTDGAKRKQLAEQMQLLAFDEVPYVPWGQWVQPSVYRKSVQGVLQFPAAIFWNVWMET